ncbi:MAG: hypothetical protein K2N03_09030 [Muribaculaceae bacterium]|nr:hypothetical protein [Muribaculaceae bacterium]
MVKEYSEDFFLSSGETNAEKEMSLPLLVSKLIDIATSHANSLGIGNPDMKKESLGWVLARLTVDMKSYPKVNTRYRITTWVESWNRHFSERAFCISDAEGNVFGYARSVWMVLDANSRVNAGLSDLNFNSEMISARECPVARQQKHIKIDTPPIASYTFQYCDLDAYRHVNTVRYVVILLNLFPLRMHDTRRVSRLELAFLHEARYGETVTVHSEEAIEDEEGTTTSLYMTTAEHPVLYSRIRFTER